MPNTYIKDSGDWALVQRPWVKDGGSWKPIKKIWVKTDPSSAQVVTLKPITVQLTTPGALDWKVPLTIANNFIKVTIVGGGGGGGGGGAGSGGESGGSGCGGGSGYTVKDQVISVTPGETLRMVVGLGGNGGLSHYSRTSRPGYPNLPEYSGGNGTPSSVFRNTVSLLSVQGGNGGGPGVENTSQPGYSATGGSGYKYGGSGGFTSSGTIKGGDGGDSELATGAIGVANISNATPSGSLGSGGAGGAAGDSPDIAVNGGKGGDGVIYITYDEAVITTQTIGGWKQVFGNTGTQIFRNSATTKIYPVGGNIKSYVVPTGVTQLTVSAIAGGGSGGDGAGAGGGSDGPHGGYKGQAVTTILSVTPGETLTVELGVGGLPVAYGSGLAGKPGSDTVIKRGSTELLRVTGGAGGERNTSGTSLSRGENSDAPFNGPGGAFTWGGQGEPGIVGSGGAGVDGSANGKTSGAGGAGAVYISTPAVSTFTVPPGVYSIDVTFPSADGNVMTVPVAVTPKDNIAITIGGIGQDSSFGSLVIPHENYNKRVIYHYGSVDRYFRQTVQVATATGNSYTSANNVGANWPDYAIAGVDDQATISSQALAKGITITTDLENSWGDLKQYIQVNPLKNDGTLPSSLVATVVKTKGRGPITIEQQPNSGNGYKVRTLVDDNSPSAADWYEYSVYVETPAYISISY